MAVEQSKQKRKKGLKHWAMFGLRWGVAAVGVWLVVKNMSLHDRALVLLPGSDRPVNVALAGHEGEDALVFHVIDPDNSNRIIAVPRENVLNAPDASKVEWVQPGENRESRTMYLLGLKLAGDLNQNPTPVKLLIAENPKTGPTMWIPPEQAPKYSGVPHPLDQVGLETLVKEANLWLLLAAVLIFPVTFVITSYRWHEMLKLLEIEIPQSRTFVLNMVGCFYNTFLPGSTGGDAFKAYYISKLTPHRTRAVMSVLVDRAVGLLALIIVGGVTASFQWQIKDCRRVSIGAALICACTALGLLLFYNKTLHRLSGLDFFLRKLPMQKQVRGAIDTMHRYGQRPWLALWTLIVSLPVHGTVVTSAMFAGMAFGLPLHWTYYWVAVPVIVLAGALPGPPQGAGVMEFFAWLLTRGQGVTVSQAFALTMSIRMVQIIWNLTGGLFVLRGGFHAPTEGEQKELDTLPDEANKPTDDEGPGEMGFAPA
jgi:uncharacterized protein (TIRG00374 family)